MLWPTSGQATHLGERRSRSQANKLTEEFAPERMGRKSCMFSCRERYLWSAVNPGRQANKTQYGHILETIHWNPLHIAKLNSLEGRHHHAHHNQGTRETLAFWQNCLLPKSKSGSEWRSHNWVPISSLCDQLITCDHTVTARKRNSDGGFP